MPYKGLRRRLTIRLKVPVFIAAAEAAARRRWPMSEYVAYAVEEQLRRDALAARNVETRAS
jgi:hypothetical protein